MNTETTGRKTIGQKLRHELREMIPVALFFLIAFELLAITQTLMLEQYGIKASTFLAAALGAMVVAKVVLIADYFPWVNRFPQHPLLYNVFWKTAIYFAASLVVRYIEHVIRFWRKYGSFDEANRRLVDEVVWPHIICVQLWLLVLLLVYCSMRELTRVIGRDRVFAMFFRQTAGADGGSPT